MWPINAPLSRRAAARVVAEEYLIDTVPPFLPPLLLPAPPLLPQPLPPSVPGSAKFNRGQGWDPQDSITTEVHACNCILGEFSSPSMHECSMHVWAESDQPASESASEQHTLEFGLHRSEKPRELETVIYVRDCAGAGGERGGPVVPSPRLMPSNATWSLPSRSSCRNLFPRLARSSKRV